MNQKFWLSSSAVNNNHNAIIDGVGNWTTSATPFDFTETSVKSQSRLDFYHGDIGPNCAWTELFVDTTRIDPEAQDWWWAKVTLDPSLKNTQHCGAAGHRQGIVAHEIGHAMGLDHPANVYTGRLMHLYIADTSTNNPQPDDVAGINYLY